MGKKRKKTPAETPTPGDGEGENDSGGALGVRATTTTEDGTNELDVFRMICFAVDLDVNDVARGEVATRDVVENLPRSHTLVRSIDRTIERSIDRASSSAPRLTG